MINAVIYARYSSDNQREESIDAQVRAINDYATRNGYQIIREYRDEARSATTDNRPQFLQMVKDAASMDFQVVIVHKLDRFARNRFDSAFYKRELDKCRVKLVSVLENLDGSPESIILESMLEGMAEYYSQNLSREVKKGLNETALKCQHTGGKPSLGYDVGPDKKYILNESEAEIVRFIFQRFAEGYGYKRLIGMLNERGLKAKTGKPFSQSTLRSILTNEKYTGIYIFNRSKGRKKWSPIKTEEDIVRIPGGMPQIIDADLFKTTQEKLRRSQMNAANKAKVNYLLSGKMYCSQCGALLSGHTAKDGRNKHEYSRYHCGTRRRAGDCDLKAINKDFIENLVIKDLQKNLLNPLSIQSLADQVLEFYENMKKTDTIDVKAFRGKSSEVQKKIDNIIDHIASGTASKALTDRLSKLEQEKAEIETIIREATRKSVKLNISRDMVVQYLEKDIVSLKNKNPEDLKKIIQTYVKKVVVSQETVEVFLIVHTIDGAEAGLFKATMSRILIIQMFG